MKRLLTLIPIVALMSCGDKSVTPPSNTWFQNSNVTITDYSYSLSAATGGHLVITFTAPNITGISKVELISGGSAISTVTPPAALSFHDYSRTGITPTTPTIYYHLKFTKTDNSTFVTQDFTVPK